MEQITVSHGIYLCAGKPTKVAKKSGDKTKPKRCILAVGELSTSSTTPKRSDALQAEEHAKSPPALSPSPTPYAPRSPSPPQSPSPHNVFFIPQEDPDWYEEGHGHQQSDKVNEESQHNISDSGKIKFPVLHTLQCKHMTVLYMYNVIYMPAYPILLELTVQEQGQKTVELEEVVKCLTATVEDYRDLLQFCHKNLKYWKHSSVQVAPPLPTFSDVHPSLPLPTSCSLHRLPLPTSMCSPHRLPTPPTCSLHSLPAPPSMCFPHRLPTPPTTCSLHSLPLPRTQTA